MRTLVGSAFVSLFLLGACGESADRLSGDGCQPACQTIDAEGMEDAHRQAVCLTENLLPDECARTNQTPICSTGVVFCDPSGGAPTCPDNPDAVPYCDGF